MASLAAPITRPAGVTPTHHPPPAARLALLSLLVGFGPAFASPLRAETPLPSDAEIEIKASFIYTLAKFVTWPARAFPHRESPIVFCALQDDPLGAALERISAGRTIAGRAIFVRKVASPADSDGCHLLFIGGPVAERMPGLLVRAGSAGVLTIGEEEEFTTHGGIVRLRMNQAMVQAEVDEETAERAGLRISSNFLRLSGIVTISNRAGRP